MPDVKVHRLKRAIVKEEYIAITGDVIEAIILNQMIYWSERVNDFDMFIEEERNRQKFYGDKIIDLPLQCGWIHKSAMELKEEIMSGDSPKTIMRRMDNLVSKGFLNRRNNPNHPYDRVYQYRVDFLAVIAALTREGYTLEGYKVSLDTEAVEAYREAEDTQLHTDNEISRDNSALPIKQNVTTKGQIVPSSAQNVHSERQAVPAIPETTTETTIKTTSSPSYPPKQETRDGKTGDKTAGELDSFFEAMGIERLKRHELVAPMKAVIADLWRTRRVGKTTVSRETVKKALSCLSSEIIEETFDKFDRQGKKGQIVAPAEYIKALILNAPQDAELVRLTRHGSGTDDLHDGASFDIDEYVRLSIEILHAEK